MPELEHEIPCSEVLQKIRLDTHRLFCFKNKNATELWKLYEIKLQKHAMW